MELKKDFAFRLLRKMLEIRFFEEKIVDQYARGKVPGLAHLYIGEEAVAVGACANLKETDLITSTHRGHGHCIAKGADVNRMMAELFGKRDGYCKGKGGSMHIASMEVGMLGAMGIVGSGGPIAVGAALAAKKRRSGQVVICFFGDASTNTGAFHEASNFAALYKLPIVFVCENNLYGISVCMDRHTAIKNIADRAAGYAMPGVIVDGMDVLAVYDVVGKAVKAARKGQGPTLVECKTYRFRGHFEGDPNLGERYRDKKELESWLTKCPIKRLEGQMLEKKLATKKRIESMEEEVRRQIEDGIAYAEKSPFPRGEETLEDVFA
ncbi:MAG: thiamine pyrophosphate-dependent dehydrogenase E1 component subunit alpha [Pseudomonadota bacterium]